MKPLHVGSRVLVVAGILLISYYVGRPVYWELMSRINVGPKLAEDGTLLSPFVASFSSDSSSTETKTNSSNSDFSNSDSLKTNILSDFLKYKVLQQPIWDTSLSKSKMPPLSAFSLSTEMIKFRAKDNIIIVTFANHAFMDFVLTWVKHLTKMNVHNILVGAMDHKILEGLFHQGVPVFDMKSGMNPVDVGWGSPTFHKMGREKVILVNKILSLGFEILMCDTDMVWVKDPLPYIQRYPDADVLSSSDEVVPTVLDGSLENWKFSGAALNIGIFHWRSTEPAKKLAKEWLKILLQDDKIWDQNGFNELVGRTRGDAVKGNNELFYAYDGSLKLGILPVSIFCSGHTYFVQRLYRQLQLEPYAVHTTYQFAGTEGKRHRLREAKLFYDKAEYYDMPGGFLSFKPAIPKKLMRGGNHSVETHFALVNFQIKLIRDALAIASVLNRTLVMPALWCRYDRVWFGHPGILHNTMTPQPFLCPLDHVFEVQNMLKAHPESEYGPIINFREYTFLENRRLPDKVRESKLTIQLCEVGKNECNDTDPIEGIAVLRQNMMAEELKEALSSYQDVKILEFASMKNAFGGFNDKVTEEKFKRRVKTYTGIWCCLEQKKIGHIYYDIYWDMKPNWKPVPPSGPAEDHPPW